MTERQRRLAREAVGLLNDMFPWRKLGSTQQEYFEGGPRYRVTKVEGGYEMRIDGRLIGIEKGLERAKSVAVRIGREEESK